MEEKLLIDSIIFDVDGTLWDSTDVVADAWNQIMEKETDMTPNLTGAVLKGLFAACSRISPPSFSTNIQRSAS